LSSTKRRTGGEALGVFQRWLLHRSTGLSRCNRSLMLINVNFSTDDYKQNILWFSVTKSKFPLFRWQPFDGRNDEKLTEKKACRRKTENFLMISHKKQIYVNP
jgi:hypothetical protein